MKSFILSFLFLIGVQAINEPPAGKRYFAAWVDSANLPNGTEGDRPVKINRRLGFNISAFHFGQNLPVTDYEFPEEQIYATGTDALVYLTVGFPLIDFKPIA